MKMSTKEFHMSVSSRKVYDMVLTLVREFGDNAKYDCARRAITPTSAVGSSVYSRDAEILYKVVINTLLDMANRFKTLGVVSDFSYPDFAIGYEQPELCTPILFYRNDECVMKVTVIWSNERVCCNFNSIAMHLESPYKAEWLLASKLISAFEERGKLNVMDMLDIHCLFDLFEFDMQLVNEFMIEITDGAGFNWNNYPTTDTDFAQFVESYKALTMKSPYKDVLRGKPAPACVFNRICSILNNIRFGGSPFLSKQHMSRDYRYRKKSRDERHPFEDSLFTRKLILAGPSALALSGLTDYVDSDLIVWTNKEGINGLHNGFVQYCFNPEIDTNNNLIPNEHNRKIMVPTQERAILEYIRLQKYFSKVMLVDALVKYDQLNNGDLSKLLDMAPMYHCTKNMVAKSVREFKPGWGFFL